MTEYMKIVVIDVGTSSMRGAILGENGECLTSVSRKYLPEYKENGEVEQDARIFSESLYSILQELEEKRKEAGYILDGIVLCAQRSALLAVDAAGVPLMRTIMWQDKRTVRLCRRMEEQGLQEFVYQRSGSPINTVYSGIKMKWLRENNPKLYENIYKFLVVPEYLLYLLTGEYVTDETYASRSLLMNIHTKRWDKELLSLFGVDEGKLCTINPPGSVIGYLSKKCSELTGMETGIPIISAGGDQQCSLIGQHADGPGICSLTVGTGAFLIRTCNACIGKRLDGIVYNVASGKNSYIMECNILACTSVIDWLQRVFFQGEKNFYDVLDTILSRAEAKKEICGVVPYFQGRGTPDFNSAAKGVLYGLTLADDREDITLAVVLSICMEVANQIEVLENKGEIQRLLVNGGLSRSQHFIKLLANVTGKETIVCEGIEATTYGAYLVGCLALNKIPPTTDRMKKIVYLPDQQQFEGYRIKRQKMNAFYDKQFGNLSL